MLFENKDDRRQIEREKEKPTTIATVAATENPTTATTATHTAQQTKPEPNGLAERSNRNHALN